MAGTDQLSAVFSALADPTRRAILAELADRDATVTELTAPLSDVDAGGVTAPEGARARRAHLAVAVGQVAGEPPRGCPAARGGRLDRALPAVLGLVPHRLDAHLAAVQPAGRATDRRRRQGALMDTDTPQLVISRVFDAPRELVYRAFTDPGPRGGVVGPDRRLTAARRDGVRHPPRRLSAMDGGHCGRARASGAHPHRPHGRRRRRTAGRHHACHWPAAGGHRAVRDELRVEFHDETDGRTRLEIRQWLPRQMASPSDAGWREAFTKLDAMLVNVQADAVDRRGGAAWQS